MKKFLEMQGEVVFDTGTTITVDTTTSSGTEVETTGIPTTTETATTTTTEGTTIRWHLYSHRPDRQLGEAILGPRLSENPDGEGSDDFSTNDDATEINGNNSAETPTLEESSIELYEPTIDLITKGPFQAEQGDTWIQRVLASLQSVPDDLHPTVVGYM
ncbi:unnamed protein product, partial [Mesorhabditis spiculigera]